MLCIENESIIGIDVSTMFSDVFSTSSGISYKVPDEEKTDQKPDKSVSTESEVDNQNNIADDGEPLF